ncbi:MAG: hypothetical protein NT166_25620 [Candidatus Aminicenantes bacterium]|nr:hypothetical protein [Candidatus Aminicenantes bacterium]
MTKKPIFITLFWIVFLIFSIFLYLLFYFVPSIEGINHQKRELNDMNLKIENFLDMQKTFSFSDEKEIKLLNAADTELRNRIPNLKSKERVVSLLTRAADFIKKRARADGIVALHVTDNRDSPEVSGVSGGTGVRVNLSFPGPLKNVVNFINHLYRSDYNLGPEGITAMAVGNSVYYTVVLKVYTSAGKGDGGEMQDQDIMIDSQSPVLLKQVYENPMEAYTRQELSPGYGAGIF